MYNIGLLGLEWVYNSRKLNDDVETPLLVVLESGIKTISSI